MRLSNEIMNSVSLEFSALATQKKHRGERLISLGLGEPEFETPAVIVEATYQAIKEGFTRYSNPFGLVELREKISEKLKADNGIEAEIDNILVAPGAKNGLYLALVVLIQPGDEIINITPSYVSYIPEIKLAEPDAVVNNLDLRKDDFTLDWERFEKILNQRTKAIILNSPHNPTGKMFSRAELEKLANLVQVHNCYIISDEIYEKLNHSGFPHVSPGSLESLSGKVITINGFSKAFSMTGWRIGYVVADKSLIRTMARIQEHLNTNTCTFIQKGALAALDLDSVHLEYYNRELAERARYMQKAFSDTARLRLVEPQGGLFAFPNISGAQLSSDAFATQLLKSKNVAVTPGIAFGKNWDDHVRVSLAAQKETFQEGIDWIVDFAENLPKGKFK